MIKIFEFIDSVRRNRDNVRGSVMFIVIMILIITSMVGMLMLVLSHYNNKLAGNEMRRKRAFYIAERGAMEAIEILNDNPDSSGQVFTDFTTAGGKYTVEIFDSTDFSWLPENERIVRSIGMSGNAVRRLEYRLAPSSLGYNDLPGPLYIESPAPAFPGNSFTIQGPDHHYGIPDYYIPTPPGDPKPAVATIHDSASITNAIGARADQCFSVENDTEIVECSIAPDHDTLDLDALADIYAGENGELADTTDFCYGSYPNNYKVCYYPGDCHVSGGGPKAKGGSLPCPNCGGTGVITCYGCDGTGYEYVEPGVICDSCGGDGVLGCHTCDSIGYFVCPDCGGTGGNALDCDSCMGSGIYGCAECYGTGVCPECGGTGTTKKGSKTYSCSRCGTGGKGDPPGTGLCNVCGGTGGIVCPFCGGTGIDPTSGVCATCGGTGSISCPDCGGDGYNVCPVCGGLGSTGGINRVCPVCSGVGTMTCPCCDGLGTVSEKNGGQGPSGTYGAGVLVIEGDLKISGQFEWTGLIICLGDVNVEMVGGGQGIHIWGALLCRSVDFKINGNADLCWCSDALKRLEPKQAGFQVASVIEY